MGRHLLGEALLVDFGLLDRVVGPGVDDHDVGGDAEGLPGGGAAKARVAESSGGSHEGEELGDPTDLRQRREGLLRAEARLGAEGGDDHLGGDAFGVGPSPGDLLGDLVARTGATDQTGGPGLADQQVPVCGIRADPELAERAARSEEIDQSGLTSKHVGFAGGDRLLVRTDPRPGRTGLGAVLGEALDGLWHQEGDHQERAAHNEDPLVVLAKELEHEVFRGSACGGSEVRSRLLESVSRPRVGKERNADGTGCERTVASVRRCRGGPRREPDATVRGGTQPVESRPRPRWDQR